MPKVKSLQQPDLLKQCCSFTDSSAQHATLETACAQPLVQRRVKESQGQMMRLTTLVNATGASIQVLIDTSFTSREATYDLKASIHATSNRMRDQSYQ